MIPRNVSALDPIPPTMRAAVLDVVDTGEVANQVRSPRCRAPAVVLTPHAAHHGDDLLPGAGKLVVTT